MLSQVLISKKALLHNFRVYKKAANPAEVMCVIKSNAYGHGMAKVSSILQKECNWFGVASGSEALELRQNKIQKNILVLSFYDSAQIISLIKNKIVLPVYTLEQAKQISQTVKKLNLIARVHIKVDVGTSRIGFLPDDVASILDQVQKLSGLKVEGLFSHLAASEEGGTYTQHQLERFKQITQLVESRGLKVLKHMACSAAITNYPQTRADMVRLGLGLYGLWPSGYTRKKAKFKLLPVLSWKTKVIQAKTLPKGTFVGYGMTFKAQKQIKIAILPVGYFDGYDRKLSNNSEVLINGSKCPVIGRICMNLFMVNVTGVENVKVGDDVVLIGRQGAHEITADDLAKRISTINYEVVTRINPLIPRIAV